MDRTKIKNNLQKVDAKLQKSMPIMFSVETCAISLFSNITCLAASGAQGLIQTIFELVATMIIVLGIVLAVMGVIHYASAYSEGDGPAKQKAMMQIAAGAMVILISALLKSKYAATFAGYITEG